MNRLIIFIILFPVLSGCALKPKLFRVDDSKIGVKYKRIRGTIFETENYMLINPTGFDAIKEWTPASNDIELVEQILNKEIKKLDHNYPRDYGPRVDSHLNGYFRQYVGYINNQGQKMMYVYSHWNRINILRFETYDRLHFNSDYEMVMDGGSYHWEAEVNLDEKKLVNFGVHGVG